MAQTLDQLELGGAVQNTDLLLVYRSGVSYSIYGSVINGLVTNVMTTLGDLITGGASGVPVRLAGNVTITPKYLKSTGDGVNATAEAWAQVNFTDLAGNATVAQGGTNITTYAQYDMLYASAANTLAKLAKVNSAVLCSSAAGLPEWLTTLPAVVGGALLVTDPTQGGPNATAVNTALANIYALAGAATDLEGGVLGSVPYQSAPNTTLFVTPNITATKKFYNQTGTGAVGAAPEWDILAAGDIPSTLNATTFLTSAQVKVTTATNALFDLTRDSGAAITNGTTIAILEAKGANDNAHTLGIGGQIAWIAAQDWTGSHQGAKMTFNTIPINSTTPTLALTLAADQSATFANTVNATTFVGALTGNATTSTTATNIAAGTAGELVVQTGAGATGFITTDATNTHALFSTGTGTNPGYRAIANNDLPVTSQGAVGTWTVTIHSAAVLSGTPSYATTYTTIGNMCFCTLEVTVSGGSFASTGGTTYVTGLPFSVVRNNASINATDGNTAIGYGNGLVGLDGKVWLPTFSVTNNVSISFWYELS